MWKIIKEMGTPDHLTCLLRHLYTGQLEPDWNHSSRMEPQTGSKLGKEYNKVVYYQSVYLTYMQSTSCKMSDCMIHKQESRLPGININNLRYADNTTLMAEREEELESLLMNV